MPLPYSVANWIPPAAYVSRVHQAYFDACASRRMPVRIPDWVFHDVVEPDDAVICLLNHIDYMLGLRGKKSGLGYAAYVLGRTGRPLTEVIVNGKAPAGVNAHALRLVREIMDTGTAEEYASLANFKDRQPSARTSENE